MNKNKLGIGALTLALSIGIMSVPQRSFEIYSISHAAEINTENPTDRLQRLIDEYDKSINTPDYQNADPSAQDKYKNAIEEGRSALKENKTDNIDTIIQSIKDLKKVIGLSEHNKEDSKKALEYLIKIAQSILDFSEASNDKNIEDKITRASGVLLDSKSTIDDIDNESFELLDLILEDIKDNNLDPNEYNLSYEELDTNLHIIMNESKYKEIKDLLENYELNDINIVQNKEIYADNYSSNAMIDINDETELRKILSDLTSEDHNKVIASDDYKNATKEKTDTYDKSIETGKSILIKEDPKASVDELKNTIDTINSAKTNLSKSEDTVSISTAKTSLEDNIELANKVINDTEYKNVSDKEKDILNLSLENSKEAIKSDDPEVIKKSNDDLKSALYQDEIKSIVDKIKGESKDELSYRSKIKKIIEEDSDFRKTSIFTKAQKSLQDAYINSLEEAKLLLDKDVVKDEELEACENSLSKAKQALDGDMFGRRYEELRSRYEKDKSKIKDDDKREEIGVKIEELGKNNSATMDDLIALEKELDEYVPRLEGTSTVPKTSGSVTVSRTPSTSKSTTKTPVTTRTVDPKKSKSIVRTGIESIAGVGIVLIVAAGALILTRKKK